MLKTNILSRGGSSCGEAIFLIGGQHCREPICLKGNHTMGNRYTYYGGGTHCRERTCPVGEQQR